MAEQRRDDLILRTKRFALDVIRLIDALPSTNTAIMISRQLMRSGTSVGAHVREAKHSRSNAEMLSKASVALQELEESRYWIEILNEGGIAKRHAVDDLLREAMSLSPFYTRASRP